MKKIFLLLFILYSIFGYGSVIVTAPTLSISSCTFPSAYNALGNIVITEGNAKDFNKNESGKTIVINAPSNFEFQTSGLTVTKNTGDISSISYTMTSATITITYSTSSSENQIDTITISGLMIRSTANSSSVSMFGTHNGTIAGMVDGTTVFATLSSVCSPLSENCSNAQNLGSLTSPYSSTTVGYSDDITTCHTGAPDRIFYIYGYEISYTIVNNTIVGLFKGIYTVEVDNKYKIKLIIL